MTKLRKLNRATCHRMSMLAKHERIETTVAKAKEFHRLADNMVQLGKEGTLCGARRAGAFVRGNDVIHKLFTELAYRYKDRAGGYTRMLRTRIRIGDAAPMAYIEENKLWAHLGVTGCNFGAYHSQHLAIIKALCLESKLGVALWLRNSMLQNFLVPDVLTHNYLVNGFCKSGDLETAKWIIIGMICRGPSPNCATYNTLMVGYCASNDLDKALDLPSTMNTCAIRPNRVTCNILVHALCNKGLLGEATKLLEQVQC
ncbi:pentatricopeptide repeat-containing protein At5g24830 isoform X2 [Daucus carota subsp. sativus]|uniref:pentatricopeptide repeat-containing protein At5g24830 isoform X2 n=1 Tax=Daucus carota subsp. sativus TaxID=79200 RepID=UPI0007EF165E|nr:PREDICTED: pentatricopeptide repeat-containing protein At5g24830-like isoform X2 [Daucus carota subsp. sativus]